MQIAVRVLTLRKKDDLIGIPVRIFVPERSGASWACRFEVEWPDAPLRMASGGVDAVQALELALKMIGAQIYASDHHASGNLIWEAPGQGYGFPVPASMRDVLVGDDRALL